MSVEVRTAPARAAAGTVINAAANTAREQIAASQVMDWAMKGYVYTCGVVMDGADIPTTTSTGDAAPTVALVSPQGSDYIVIPLRVWASLTDGDAGAQSTLDLVYTKAARQCAATLVITGTTTLFGTRNHLTVTPMAEPKSAITYTCSSSAIVAADSCILAHAHAVDAALTYMMMDEYFDYVFSVPIALTEGAALLLYAYTSGTAGTIRPAFTWAEIPANAYRP